jgi:Cdc6-like AAA superfamily ATPase
MKKLMLSTLALCCVMAFAADKHGDKERQEDIARHRAMAAAHEGAAKCLEAGKQEEVCEAELQAVCKGLAIGKMCGMKHQH